MEKASKDITPERIFEKAFIKVFAREPQIIREFFSRKKERNEKVRKKESQNKKDKE